MSFKNYMRGTLADRLEAKTVRVPFGGCWVFMGRLNEDGYGDLQESGGRRKIKAHRASYEINRGPIPIGAEVCHHCDVRCCVNPEHLFIGTRQENIDDMVGKQRHPRGETVGRSKITEDDAREIRALYASGSITQRDISLRFGIHNSVVSKIVNRKNWKHV